MTKKPTYTSKGYIYFVDSKNSTSKRKLTLNEKVLLDGRLDIFIKPPHRNIHRVYHNFVKKFTTNIKFSKTEYKYSGHEFMVKFERWAKNYPNDIQIVRCDDKLFMGARLYLIDHKSKSEFMGTTVIYANQITDPTTFFLYPYHTKDLINALVHVKKLHKQYIPITKKAQKELNSILKTIKY